jgi:hypothetical protein
LEEDREKKDFTFWLLTALLFVLVIVSVRLLHPQAICGDTAMYLLCGRLILAGQSPYDQFIDLNPPLINYLNVIPALLADLLHCPLTIAGIMVMAAVTALSVAVTALVLRLACQKLGLSFALLGAPVILSLAVFSAFLGIDYGQREHLIALLFFPFFFMRWLTWRLAASQSQSQSQSSSAGQHWLLKAFIGTAFGLALSLKPYVIIFPLLLELYWLVRYRTWRSLLSIEMLTVFVVPLIYLAWSQFLFAGPGRENFYHFIVPLVLQNYCALNSLSVAMVNLFWLPTLLVLLIVLPATFFLPRGCGLRAPMALVLATSLSYVELQTLFWPYHAIFLHLFIATTIFILLANLGRPGLWQRRLLLLFSAILATVVPLSWWLIVDGKINKNWQAVFNRRAKCGDRVLLLHCGTMPWYEYSVDRGLLPGCRYLWAFPVRMLQYQKAFAKTEAKKNEAEQALSKVVSEIGEDMDRLKPRFIFLYRPAPMDEQPVMYEFYAEHGLKSRLEQYQIVFEEGGFVVFEKK